MFSEGQLAAERYILQAKLADGRLGPVFRAVDVQSGNAVALRPIVLPSSGAEALERDLREIADLRHPNIASGELQFAEDHQPFLAYEFIDGKSLEALIRDEGPLALPRACSLGRQIAGALEAAHHAGIIHGDLKPSSVLVTGGPDEEIIKVCGFGTYSLKRDRFVSLVRLAMPPDGKTLFGLPEYIAPEQALGTSGDALDGRSDLYSLGVILYQMLTGAVPHLGPSPMETLLAKIFAAPAPIASQLEIPLVVQTLVIRSLAKRRDDRPASATVIADQLAAWEQKKAAPAAVAPSQPEHERLSDVEVGHAALVTDTILASSRADRLAKEPAAPHTFLNEPPPELAAPGGAEFVPDLQPSGVMDSRSSANPSPSPASDAAIDLDLAEAASGPPASQGLDPDLASAAAANPAALEEKEAGGVADALDVQFGARKPDTTPQRGPVVSAQEPFYRPAATSSTIFGSFQPRPKRRGLKPLSVAAIVILIILAGGCGWLYYSGRTYWFNPSYVRMRISTFFAGSSSTPQVRTDAYSQSATSPTSPSPAPNPVLSAPRAASAGTSAVTMPATQPPKSSRSGTAGGQLSSAIAAPSETAGQAGASNSTPVAGPAETQTLSGKPAAGLARARRAMKRANQHTESAQSVAGDVAAAVTRGDYYFNLGDYDAAIRAYEDGLAHAPGNQQLDSEIARARKAQAAEAKYLR